VNSGRIKYGENVDFTVPTGNFGDILAGYIAKKIGLPVNKLICASDKNNVLYDFFKTGVYDKRREFYKTNSPAMDILISSNLERLLYYASDENAEYVSRLMKELKENGYYKVGKEVLDNLKDFIPYCQDETETEKCIFRAYEKYNYLIDPHTAVAYGAAENIKGGNYNVILSTASPYKFADTIAKALNLRACKSEFETVAEIEKFTNTKAPAAVKALENFDRKTETLNRNQIEDRIYYRNKFIVKTPATSANLCVGFDCIGMAVNIYNKYKFEKAEKDGTEGFGAFGIEDNLVLKAYKETFEFIRKDYVPVKITMIETGVPVARGLGSSSCCIVAGVLAAERISGVKLSGEEKIRIAAKIEGHPDNVAPCILGGIVASVADTENLIYSEFEISDKLSVILAIPDLISKTEEARAILPEVYKRSDVVHNLSRAFLLSDALKRGDTERLRIIFDDKIHEPYRLPLIPKALEIKKYANENGFACCLSGAGSTLLILGYGDGIIKDLTEKFGEHYKFIKALAVKTGAEIIGLI